MEKGRGKGTDTLQTDKVFTRKEYIERDAAVMKIREWFWSAPGVHPKLDRDAAEDILFAIPAADVVPVRHGRWVHPVPGDGEPYCSVCHAEAEYFYGYGSFEPDFCPSCGARMDMVTDCNQVKNGDGK